MTHDRRCVCDACWLPQLRGKIVELARLLIAELAERPPAAIAIAAAPIGRRARAPRPVSRRLVLTGRAKPPRRPPPRRMVADHHQRDIAAPEEPPCPPATAAESPATSSRSVVLGVSARSATHRAAPTLQPPASAADAPSSRASDSATSTGDRPATSVADVPAVTEPAAEERPSPAARTSTPIACRVCGVDDWTERAQPDLHLACAETAAHRAKIAKRRGGRPPQAKPAPAPGAPIARADLIRMLAADRAGRGEGAVKRGRGPDIMPRRRRPVREVDAPTIRDAADDLPGGELEVDVERGLFTVGLGDA